MLLLSCSEQSQTESVEKSEKETPSVKEIRYPDSMPKQMVDSLKRLRERLITKEKLSEAEANKAVAHFISEFEDPKNNEELQEKATSLIFAISHDIEQAKTGVSIEENISAARLKLDKLTNINLELRDPDYDLCHEVYTQQIESIKMANKAQ